jgi:hypothetical protein
VLENGDPLVRQAPSHGIEPDRSRSAMASACALTSA